MNDFYFDSNSLSHNVPRLSRSLGLVNEILHLKTKLQRNRNSQPSEMPKFWLAAVSKRLIHHFIKP